MSWFFDPAFFTIYYPRLPPPLNFFFLKPTRLILFSNFPRLVLISIRHLLINSASCILYGASILSIHHFFSVISFITCHTSPAFHLQHSLVNISLIDSHLFLSLFASCFREHLKGWLLGHIPSPWTMLSYILTLLLLPPWLLSYNWLRLWEDAVAGIALSLVIIPQSIGFGIMTHISPMHGLYSTFAGLALY